MRLFYRFSRRRRAMTWRTGRQKWCQLSAHGRSALMSSPEWRSRLVEMVVLPPSTPISNWRGERDFPSIHDTMKDRKKGGAGERGGDSIGASSPSQSQCSAQSGWTVASASTCSARGAGHVRSELVSCVRSSLRLSTSQKAAFGPSRQSASARFSAPD